MNKVIIKLKETDKKICMILGHDFLHPQIDSRPYKEAKSLIKEGYNVFIVCWAVDHTGEGKSLKTLSPVEDFEGIKIMRIFQNLSSPKSTVLVRGFQHLRAIKKLGKKVIELKPDAIHCHDLDTLLSGVIAKKKINTPLIYDSHEDWPAMFAPVSIIISKLASIFEKILLKHADCVITVSEELVKKFKGLKQTNIVAIYNSRMLSELLQKEEPKGLRKELKISDAEFIVGYIGSLSKKKRRIDNLIKSIKYVDNKSVKVLIVGGPENEVNNLRALAEKEGVMDKVILTGHIPYFNINPYFLLVNIGTVFFEPLPNNLIAAPNKLFEYMGAGLPLIVSDFPEMRRIVVDESDCGVATDPTNPEKIADAITYLIEHPEDAKKMGENGRGAVEEKYSWEKMEERLLKIYKEILP